MWVFLTNLQFLVGNCGNLAAHSPRFTFVLLTETTNWHQQEWRPPMPLFCLCCKWAVVHCAACHLRVIPSHNEDWWFQQPQSLNFSTKAKGFLFEQYRMTSFKLENEWLHSRGQRERQAIGLWTALGFALSVWPFRIRSGPFWAKNFQFHEGSADMTPKFLDWSVFFPGSLLGAPCCLPCSRKVEQIFSTITSGFQIIQFSVSVCTTQKDRKPAWLRNVDKPQIWIQEPPTKYEKTSVPSENPWNLVKLGLSWQINTWEICMWFP